MYIDLKRSSCKPAAWLHAYARREDMVVGPQPNAEAEAVGLASTRGIFADAHWV